MLAHLGLKLGLFFICVGAHASGPGSYYTPNQLPKNWMKIYSFSSDTGGRSGEFYAEMENEWLSPVNALVILKDSKDANDQLIHFHYKTILFADLNKDRQVLFEDSKSGRPTAFAQAQVAAYPAITTLNVSMLTSANIFNSSKDEFGDFQVRIKVLNGKYVAESSADNFKTVFETMHSIGRKKFGKAVGIREVHFLNGNKAILSTVQFP